MILVLFGTAEAFSKSGIGHIHRCSCHKQLQLFSSKHSPEYDGDNTSYDASQALNSTSHSDLEKAALQKFGCRILLVISLSRMEVLR